MNRRQTNTIFDDLEIVYNFTDEPDEPDEFEDFAPGPKTLTATETLTVLRRKGRVFVSAILMPADTHNIEVKKGDLIQQIEAMRREHQAEGVQLWFEVIPVRGEGVQISASTLMEP